MFVDERNGKKKQDIWKYKDYQYPTYPTEKNIDLLKSIVLASSNPNDLVLDCFCGSGTTLQASQELGRNWIGIDQSEEAIKITQERLKNIPSSLFIGSVDYEYLEDQKHIIQETFLETKSFSVPKIAGERKPVFERNLVSI
ncbi:MAG: site-specific DNA-methyltransferase [Patescibacteria group bacterium]